MEVPPDLEQAGANRLRRLLRLTEPRPKGWVLEDWFLAAAGFRLSCRPWDLSRGGNMEKRYWERTVAGRLLSG